MAAGKRTHKADLNIRREILVRFCNCWLGVYDLVTEPPSDTRHGLATPFERSNPCRGLTRPKYGHRASRRSVWQWQDQDPCRPLPSYSSCPPDGTVRR